MKNSFCFIGLWTTVLVGVFPHALLAGRTSATYSITTESQDAAGGRSASPMYTSNGSLGGSVGVSTVGAPAEIAKHGFIGQLYDVVGLSVASSPGTDLNENSTGQLAAAPLLDDATKLAPLAASSVTWSIVSGPITSISSAGVATAGTVYQNTPAIVGAAYLGKTGQLNLTVLNVTNDDLGAYAGDGIDDAWQVQYFGQNNLNASPLVDADGDGFTNNFEYKAGLIPTDASSRFLLQTASALSPTSPKQFSFGPIVSGRVYVPQFTTSLTNPSWTTLSGFTQTDAGTTRTITDVNASGPQRFYRVEIQKP